MIELNAFAKEVYENAKAHGFWDSQPDIDTLFALIHSEWSEALEEYRAGRIMLWHRCDNTVSKTVACEQFKKCHYIKEGDVMYCPSYKPKPEGIAVELIDGVLRIFDFCGKHGLNLDEAFQENEAYMYKSANIWREDPLPHLITALHRLTSLAFDAKSSRSMCRIIVIVFEWIRARGVDPETVMREKHAYNKTRPYRHGGKIC